MHHRVNKQHAKDPLLWRRACISVSNAQLLDELLG